MFLSNSPTAVPGIASKHQVDAAWSSTFPNINKVNINNDK